MTLPSNRLSRLQTFFWAVLAFNLAEYAAVGFYMARAFNLYYVIQNGSLRILLIFVLLLLLPSLLIFQAFFILNNYFPARAFGGWFRGFILSLCIVQILSSLFFAVISFSGVLEKMPGETRIENYDYLELREFFMAISMFLASLWNLAAAVVLLRTVRGIRKNYQERAWESFEAS